MTLYVNGIPSGGGVHASVVQGRTPWVGARVTMPLGDSITQGFGSSSGTGFAGYRNPLFRNTLTVGKPLDLVGTVTPTPTFDIQAFYFSANHEGHIGFTIADLAGVVDAAIAATVPDIILLHIGTNDVPHPDIVTAPARLASLIDQIHTDRLTAKVVLATIVPSSDAGVNIIIDNYNAAMPAIVAARAAYCSLTDINAAFKAVPSYGTVLLFDGVHPNDAGYAVMATEWATAISGF